VHEAVLCRVWPGRSGEGGGRPVASIRRRPGCELSMVERGSQGNTLAVEPDAWPARVDVWLQGPAGSDGARWSETWNSTPSSWNGHPVHNIEYAIKVLQGAPHPQEARRVLPNEGRRSRRLCQGPFAIAWIPATPSFRDRSPSAGRRDVPHTTTPKRRAELRHCHAEASTRRYLATPADCAAATTTTPRPTAPAATNARRALPRQDPRDVG